MEHRKIEEASQTCGVPSDIIIHFIEQEWIIPKETLTPVLDDEDIARIKLIQELRVEFEVNDEAIPIILNLLDQLNRIHLELARFRTH